MHVFISNILNIIVNDLSYCDIFLLKLDLQASSTTEIINLKNNINIFLTLHESFTQSKQRLDIFLAPHGSCWLLSYELLHSLHANLNN